MRHLRPADFCCVCLCLLACAFSHPGAWGDKADYEDVSVVQAGQTWQDGEFDCVLDVRTAGEYDQGHIPGAYSLNYYEFDERLGEIMDRREEDILVYCQSGARSASASQRLTDEGFTGVHNMLGGFNAWVAEGYEVEGNGETVGCVAGSMPRGHSGYRPGDILLTLLAMAALFVAGTNTSREYTRP